MIKRWGVQGLPWAIVVLFALVVLGPALLGRGVLLDVDLLTIRAPWGVKHHIDAVVCRSDTVDFYLPGIKNIKDALWSGHLFSTAMWAPYEVGGTPLASLPDHAALNPLSWPYFVLPLWLAPAFVKLAELVAVLLGMVAFLGRVGVRRQAALIAGLLFFCSGYMVMWTNWPQSRVGAWIPALFWALDRAATRRGARDVGLLGLVVAAMVLGGFPAVTMFALTAGGIYVLCRSPRRRAWIGWLVSGAGVVLGAAIAAVQLLPFVRNVGEIGLDQRSPGPHPPFGQLATTVAPNLLGNCVAGVKTGSVNPVEGIAFLGVAALALIACAVLLRSRASTGDRVRWILLGLLAGTVVLVWVGTPLLTLLQRLPGYDTNNIGRATSVFGFLGAALAGIGLDRLWHSERLRWPRRGAPLLVLVGVVLTVGLGAWAFRDARHEIVKPDNGPSVFDHALVLPAAMALVVIVGLGVALRWRRVGACVVVAAALVQSATFAHTEWPLSSRSSFYPDTPTHQFLAAHLGEDRYGAGGGTMLTATSDWYHLRTPTGHEFTQPQWKDLLQAIAPSTMLTNTYSQFPVSLRLKDVATSHLLDQLSVRYWVAGHGVTSDAMPTVFKQGDATVFERPTALPRIRWAGVALPMPPDQQVARLAAGIPDDTILVDGVQGDANVSTHGATATVDVVRDQPGSISADVDATGSGYLVVADAVVRDGWTATVDGHDADIVRANHAFGAVPVTAGSHRVTLTYRAPGLRTGALVSLAALIATAVLVAGIPRRRRRALDFTP